MLRNVRRFGVWPDGAAIAVTWLVLWVITVAGRGQEWAGSWDQSLEAVNTSSIVLWPVAAGIGCARAVQVVRSGTAGYLRAMPGWQVTRFSLMQSCVTWLGALVGGVATLAVAGVVALLFGSDPSPAFLPGFLISLLGLVAALVWGGLVGLVWSSYVAAVAVTFAAYIVPGYTVSQLHILFDFTGSTASTGDALRLSGAAVITFLVLYGGMLVAGVLATTLREGPRRATVAAYGVAAVGLVAALAVSGLFFGRAVTLGQNNETWTYAGSSAWDCHTYPSGSRACLPRDIHAVMDQYVTAMGYLDNFNRRVFTDDPTFLYAIRSSAVDHVLDGSVFFQIETPLVDPQDMWPDSAATWFMSHASPTAGAIETAPPSQPTEAGQTNTGSTPPASICIASYDEIAGTLGEVLAGEDVDAAPFRSLLAQISQCSE